MTLTKATLADHLFQQLGLNVREAPPQLSVSSDALLE